MTRYEQGFLNKCAEYGLDAGASMELMEKSAFNWKMLGAYAKDIARHPVKAGRRWWELMRGGSDKILGRYNRAYADAVRSQNKLRETLINQGKAFDYGNDSAFKNVSKVLEDMYYSLITGKPSGLVGARNGKGYTLRQSPSGARKYIFLGDLKDMKREYDKVLATRLGTAAGATALGGGAYAAAKGGRNRGKSESGGNRILGNYSKLMEPTDGNHRILGNYANLIG